VVPLTHYGFFVVNESALKKIKDKAIQQEMRKLTGEKIMIQNDKGAFQESGYMQIQRIAKYFTVTQKETTTRKHVLNQLALYLRNNEMLPAIFFVFSRKNVEAFARDITIPVLEDDSKIPYTIKRECDAILRKLPNWEEYTALPEYHFLVGLLEKGIGIHHSGMIPILREIVELMISKKYIKILFATESFAIGLDCPIKTAVFTGLTKFDGSDHRWLMAHEYTQMAGRAGRRGIDTIGHVIHCNNLLDLPSKTEYRDILCGKAQSLISKFRISYSWVLATTFILFGQEKKEDSIALSKKSMIYEELERMIVSQKEKQGEIERDILSKREQIARISYSLDICRKYNEIQEIVGTLVNKKKKEKQREIETLETEYRTIVQDAKKVKELDILLENKTKEDEQLSFLETYIEIQIEKVQRVLQENLFLDLDSGLSILGQVASKMSEVHPLVWSGCMVEKWNYFADFSIKQIVGIMSCITDIKVPEEYRRYNGSSFLAEKDVFLQDRIVELQEEYTKYEKIEEERELRTGMKYTDVISLDIVEEAMKWCDCESEEECKVFISCELSKKEIGVGDFTKAMLKIATVAREWSVIPEIAENISLAYKLMQIDTMILKYIATNQSLYV
jgi:superfamily II RNA helicase